MKTVSDLIDRQSTNALGQVSVLYYDGQCPLCMREMKLLRRFKRNRLQLRDIHHHAELTEAQRVDMLRQLHLQLPDGRWLFGADASVEAWRYTPIGWLMQPLRWPLLGRVVDSVYRHWAKKRFQRLYGDGKTICSAPPATNDADARGSGQ